MSMKSGIIIVIVGILVLLTVVDLISPTYGFFARVDSGNVGIITHFGKIEDKVLPAGFHFTSFFEHVHPINIRTQIKGGEVVAFSSDIQQVTLYISVNYNVSPDNAFTLYQTVGEGYFDTLIAPRINEDTKAIVSKYTAESLVANRDKLSNEILELLKNDISKYGVMISTINVENIDFTDSFEAAVEAKQVATQEKQKAQTQQDQQTMEAKQEAERKKIAAEAEADVVRTKADAEAYKIKTKADAEAEANKKVAETLTDDLIQYIQAQLWNGQLPSTYVGGEGALPIIQTEAGGDEK